MDAALMRDGRWVKASPFPPVHPSLTLPEYGKFCMQKFAVFRKIYQNQQIDWHDWQPVGESNPSYQVENLVS